MAWWLRDRVQGEESTEFDMVGALAEISGGLGFEGGEGDDSGNGAAATGNAATGDSGDSLDDAGKLGESPAGGTGDDAALAPEAATGTPTPPAAAKPEVTAQQAPKTWKPDAAKEWDKLPPTVRTEIARREEEMFQGIEGYKQDAGFGRTIQKVLEPFVPILQQHNINPIQQIGDLMNAHKTLALGTPEAKVGMMRWLAKEYGIDLGAAVGQVGGQPQQEAYVDPAVQNLQQELKEVKSQLTAGHEAQRRQEYEKAASEVKAFKADPKNVYFEEVAVDMTQLINSGLCKTIPEAYEQAVYRNPVTRAKEIARQTAESEKAQKDAEAEKAAAARKATAANVRTTAKKGSAAAPLGTIDDTLNKAFDAIEARSR